MDVQQLTEYEANFQFDVGCILRDLAILMMHAEKASKYDEQTYNGLMAHIRALQERLVQLEQAIQSEWNAQGRQDLSQ